MIRKIKKMLGVVPPPEKWGEMKTSELEKLLGKEHDMVMHAIIPFQAGGGLDLYYYKQTRGYAIATKELIDEFGDGPKNKRFNAYEFCMFSPVEFNLELAKDENSEMGKSHSLLNGMLNALARYSFHAELNENETMEFPEDFGNGLAGKCLILDVYIKNGNSLMINNKKFGLMVAINIHRSEMEYARRNGGEKLLTMLKERSIYPYSDLNREPVV
jgi:hypothetical protein